MDSIFRQFIEKAKRLGLCQEYTDKIDKAGSKLAFMEIALDANGLQWCSDAICRGMLTAEYIAKEFAPFNCGRYIRITGGYKSAMYCLPDTDITITTTAALIIGHKGTIIIPKNRVCEIYLCQSDVTIQGEGRGVAYLFDSRITNQSAAPVVVKEDKRYGTQD